MIPSGRLHHHDLTARESGSSRLAAARRLADLDARRRTAEHAVDTLLETWRESPIAQQRTGWQEMDDAARDVIDALSALLGELDLARDEVAVSPLPAPRSAP